MKNELEKWHFCSDKKNANNLFYLVKSGIKTATSYLFIDDDQLKSKTYSILTNWDDTEQILLKTKKIDKVKFMHVTEEHAYKEGEGDHSLDYWRKTHKIFFTKESKKYKINFDENTYIICEEFEVIKE